MAEVVAGAISLGFPVMVYSLAEKDSQKLKADENAVPKFSRQAQPSFIETSVQKMIATSQKYITSFSDEALSDVSEESYRKSMSKSNREDATAREEPAWFRLVVQRSDLNTKRVTTLQEPNEVLRQPAKYRSVAIFSLNQHNGSALLRKRICDY